VLIAALRQTLYDVIDYRQPYVIDACRHGLICNACASSPDAAPRRYASSSLLFVFEITPH